MSDPAHDLPFEPAQIAFIARRLHALGIAPDRQWLAAEGHAFDAAFLDSHGAMLAHARQCIPRSQAQWELADFFRHAMPGAAFDCQWLTGYETFEFLYLRILGEASRPWLPSLYLAAATLPSRTEEARIDAIQTFDPEIFRLEE